MIKFVDMFSGIGGFREGLTRAGGFECVGHCEIDKYVDTAARFNERTEEQMLQNRPQTRHKKEDISR